MKRWKSTENRGHGIWSSEVRLKTVGVLRKGKVNKLLKLLKEDMVEDLSGSARNS